MFGRVPPSAPRAQQSPRQVTSKTRRRAPSRPIPPQQTLAPRSLAAAAELPAPAPPRPRPGPTVWQGGATPNSSGAGPGRGDSSATCSCWAPSSLGFTVRSEVRGRAFPSGRRRNQTWLVRGAQSPKGRRRAQCASPCRARSATELSVRACGGDKEAEGVGRRGEGFLEWVGP